MPRSPSLLPRRVVVLAVAALLAACASTAKPPEQGSGFLPSYSTLKEATDPTGRKYLSSGPIAYRGAPVSRVHASAAVLFPTDVRFPSADPAVVEQSLRHFDAQLRVQLSKHFTVVDSPAQAQVVVRPALTRVDAVPEGLSPLDLVPVRLLTKPLKDAALGGKEQSAAVLEVLLLDARSDERLNAAYRPATGRSIGRTGTGGGRVTFESIRPVLDDWAAGIAAEMAKGLPR